MIRYIIFILNRIIPKNKQLVLFASKPDFSDSALALFEEMSMRSEYAKYKLVWLTESKKKKDHVVSYQKKSIAGLWHYFRAKYIFSTHGLFAGTAVNTQVHVGLWHGMPLKRIKAMGCQGDRYKGNEFNYMLATSPFFQSIMAKCFKIQESRVAVLGLPRNDELFHPENLRKKLCLPQTHKLIIWLPTFRTPLHESAKHNVQREGSQYELGIPFWTKENISELDAFLQASNVLLIVKLHPLQKFDNHVLPYLSNIIFMTADECDSKKLKLYCMLSESDAMITDYSSVYIDYLAIDKPMAFTIDDIDKYNSDRGFSFKDPLNYMPGYKIVKKTDLFDFMITIVNEDDQYAIQRAESRPILNVFRDDKSSERVLNYFIPS